MAQKKYRVRSGSVDTWVNADSYTHALMKGLEKATSNDKVGPDASVLLEGDDEKLSVKFDLAKYHDEGPRKLPEADFSIPEFVWHQDGETYFVCEKDGYDLEVEQIDNDEWLYRVSGGGMPRMKTQGIRKNKMQAVGICEGYALLARHYIDEITGQLSPM